MERREFSTIFCLLHLASLTHKYVLSVCLNLGHACCTVVAARQPVATWRMICAPMCFFYKIMVLFSFFPLSSLHCRLSYGEVPVPPAAVTRASSFKSSSSAATDCGSIPSVALVRIVSFYSIDCDFNAHQSN